MLLGYQKQIKKLYWVIKKKKKKKKKKVLGNQNQIKIKQYWVIKKIKMVLGLSKKKKLIKMS